MKKIDVDNTKSIAALASKVKGFLAEDAGLKLYELALQAG